MRGKVCHSLDISRIRALPPFWRRACSSCCHTASLRHSVPFSDWTPMIRKAVFALALVVAMLAALQTPTRAAGAQRARTRHERLDAKLREAADEAAPAPQRVIIRVRPGSRQALRDALSAHGDHVLGEFDSIESLAAVVHGEDLATLAEDDAVLSVSADAVVHPNGLLGGLLGLVGGVVNTLGSVVGSILLPNGADTTGPVVSPEILRQTLGVDSTSWTGRGVGVAVIDSGLEMSAEFQNRVKAFY